MKELENKKELNEVEEEKVAGGRFPVFNPGEGTDCRDDHKPDEPRDGGATGGSYKNTFGIRLIVRSSSNEKQKEIMKMK